MEKSICSFESNLELKEQKFVTSRFKKKYLNTPTAYPNLYKDSVKTKVHVFANQDYIHKNVSAQTMRRYEQLEGGLVQCLEVPWNFYAKTDEEDVVRTAIACEMMDSVFQPTFTWSNKRCHIRFNALGRASYVPLVHNLISTPSVPGSYHVNVNRSFIRPEYTFVKEAQRALEIWIHHMVTVDCQTQSIHFNPGFVNLRLLTAEVRDTVIRHLASTFKRQKDLTSLTFEHAFLDGTDALRIFVAAALGAGHTLQKLYLCNLFFPKFLPLETEADYFDVYDELQYDPVNQPTYSDEMKSKSWEKLFARPLLDRMPSMAVDKYFCMALSSLSNLTVLMVNYSWLSKGNVETAAFIDLKQILVSKMPLVGVHFSNTYLLEGVGNRKPWSFSYFSRYLSSYFCNKLEMINITVWRSSCMVDICLANLIVKCNLLRVFVFRGSLDKFSSIHQIFEFLLEENKTRIKEIGFFVVDDPCRPNGWTEAVVELKNKFTAPLALKGITISLGLWKF